MRVLIVEDEKMAALQLVQFIHAFDKAIEILPVVDSCKKFRKWVQKNEAVDLIFCDIELSDGNILSTLRDTVFHSAVIFTTAYDNFWSEALKINGIDYLLKPITAEKIKAALSKAEVIKQVFSKDKNILARLSDLMEKQLPSYKKRFPVRINNDVYILEAESIIFFRIIEGVIIANTVKEKKYPMDTGTLNELEDQLNPELFFRINRSEIINANYIGSIRIQDGEYFVHLRESAERLSVSNSRVGRLKEWLDDL